MRHLAVALLLSAVALCALAQTSQPTATSDAQAVSLAQHSLAALTGGAAISDVTLKANVTSILGSDNESGTGTFRAKGTSESRSDLALANGTLSQARSSQSNGPSGAWSKNGSTAVAEAPHNLLTDASWFFPALTCLSQYASSAYVFTYIGQEQHGGVNTQHLQVALVPPAGVTSIQRLSTTDFYLDPISFLPLAVDFKVHPDNDANIDIPVEILFANYQIVNGIHVPFHIQRMLDGGVVLDVSVTNAALNTGIPDSAFTLQ